MWFTAALFVAMATAARLGWLKGWRTGRIERRLSNDAQKQQIAAVVHNAMRRA